jgi:hypothetical protein
MRQRRVRQSGKSLLGHEQRRRCRHDNGRSANAVSAAERLARLAAERVLDAADRKTPFPGELTVGFVQAAAERVLEAADRKLPPPGELAVGFPGKLKEKRGGDKEARFPDGLG